MTAHRPGGGRRVLLVEDEYTLATLGASLLREYGFDVVGPASNVDDALDMLDAAPGLDAAILDLNLQGEMSYPVADALLRSGIPFVFTTGYDASVIPARYAAVPLFEKPVLMRSLVRRLFP